MPVLPPSRRILLVAALATLAFAACPRKDQPIPKLPPVDQPGSGKPRVYGLAVRYFGNVQGTNQTNAPAAVNGVGTFDDVNDAALASLAALGVTHVWLTGALDQATNSDHPGVKPADDPDIVKGLAGSLYAVRDMFDVSPDLAAEPAQRLAAFSALLARVHAHGLKAILDLPVNGVARSYQSLIEPASSLGAQDLQTAFFSQDDFFYLVSPPNQALALPTIPWWQRPAGADGKYPPEGGGAGHVPKATGNNVTSPSPVPVDDWDEIKVNLGYDFVDQTEHFTPQPPSWAKLDAAVAYWQKQGVDGFVTQGTRYVPWPFWRFLIGAARARAPALFLGDGIGGPQAAADTGGSDMVSAGFDGLFDPQTLESLRGAVVGAPGSNGLNDLGGLADDDFAQHLVRYGESPTEPRLAAPVVVGDGVNSGLGSARLGLAATALLWLQSSGPVLLFNGQEVGEPGAGLEGYGQDDGRTTIYDYWTMPEHAKWVDGLRYDGALLSAGQLSLRQSYGALLALCGQPAFASGAYYGIQSANQGSPAFGNSGHDVLAYLRYTADGTGRYLVVGNLSSNREYDTQVVLPAEALRFMSMAADATGYLLTDTLGSGAKVTTTGAALQIAGVGLALQPATAYAFAISTP